MAVIAEKGLNILVVDDERAVTASVSFVLKKSGHAVDAVHDGEDALVKLRESPNHYQILITDHFMRKVSGLALVEQVHKKEFQGRIVVLSGYLKPELEKSYRALGVDRIIRKPFDLAELRETIEELKLLLEK